MRNAGESRSEISKLVEQRMSVYSTKPLEGKKNPVLEAVPDLKPMTQYVLVVKNGLKPCDEVSDFVKNRAGKDERIMSKQVEQVQSKMPYLRGVPTLIDIDNERIYEGSAVMQFLNAVFSGSSSHADLMAQQQEQRSKTGIGNNMAEKKYTGHLSGPGSSRSYSLQNLYGDNVTFKTDVKKYNA